METISVPMNAVRVCNAISRIGYEPHSALMDIIDNSVAAEALNVRVIVDLSAGKTINQRNNVAKYRIVDNGKGMDETGIKNAFKLGSEANYKPNSLSKYGMGLKSAGFSLGTRIQIVSKKDGILSHKYFLDRKIIEEKNDYVICYEEFTPSEAAEYEALLGGNQGGTVVEITGCGEIYHTSARTTIEKLKKRLGVTYYPFLSAPVGERLEIVLTYPGEEAHQVCPVDILSTHDAVANFDPTNYPGSHPCYAFKDEWKIQTIGEAEAHPIKLEVVTFPKGSMANAASPLSDEEKARIRTYDISRENKGFFIYRNGRLIRWGDDLDDIVGKDLIGFRGRMELTTEHDDLLHVDVSKQRLEMDDETRNSLDILMRLPRKQAKQIFEICDHLLSKGDGEGVGFSETAVSIPEEDPAEEVAPPDPDEKKQRAKKREKDSKETLEEIVSKEGEGEIIAPVEEEKFRQVRYTDNLHGVNLWSAQKDHIQGTYVLINRRHAFYQSIISNFDESSPERIVLEAIVFCCAVGENKTYENLTAVDEKNIRNVFDRFYSVLSFNLTAWAGGNQHIFEK
jgi:hypothetical protein